MVKVDDVAGDVEWKEIDFLDAHAGRAWLETRTPEERCLLASRAGMRVFCLVVEAPADRFEEAALASFRSLLIASSNAKGRRIPAPTDIPHSPNIGWIEEELIRFSADAATFAATAAAFAWQSPAQAAESIFQSMDCSAVVSGSVEIVRAPVNADVKALLAGNSLGKIWQDGPPPDQVELSHLKFVRLLEKDHKWHFFRDWYLGVWEGTWTDWDLAHEVAKIEAEVWTGEDALERVAAEIEKIKERLGRNLPRPDSVPELERRKLIEHVRKLLASPDMTALSAEGAAETLTYAIKRYFDEAPANCLPDELAHLGELPKLFRAISATVKGKERVEAKERKLASQIEALNAKVAELEAQLKEANSKTVNGLFTQSMLKAAGTAFGAGAVGSLGLAVNHLFGQWPDDLTFENLRNWLSSLEKAMPKPEGQLSLPPARDV